MFKILLFSRFTDIICISLIIYMTHKDPKIIHKFLFPFLSFLPFLGLVLHHRFVPHGIQLQGDHIVISYRSSRGQFFCEHSSQTMKPIQLRVGKLTCSLLQQCLAFGMANPTPAIVPSCKVNPNYKYIMITIIHFL